MNPAVYSLKIFALLLPIGAYFLAGSSSYLKNRTAAFAETSFRVRLLFTFFIVWPYGYFVRPVLTDIWGFILSSVLPYTLSASAAQMNTNLLLLVIALIAAQTVLLVDAVRHHTQSSHPGESQ